jgi:hypothetical protein
MPSAWDADVSVVSAIEYPGNRSNTITFPCDSYNYKREGTLQFLQWAIFSQGDVMEGNRIKMFGPKPGIDAPTKMHSS